MVDPGAAVADACILQSRIDESSSRRAIFLDIEKNSSSDISSSKSFIHKGVSRSKFGPSFNSASSHHLQRSERLSANQMIVNATFREPNTSSAQFWALWCPILAGITGIVIDLLFLVVAAVHKLQQRRTRRQTDQTDSGSSKTDYRSAEALSPEPQTSEETINSTAGINQVAFLHGNDKSAAIGSIELGWAGTKLEAFPAVHVMYDMDNQDSTCNQGVHPLQESDPPAMDAEGGVYEIFSSGVDFIPEFDNHNMGRNQGLYIVPVLANPGGICPADDSGSNRVLPLQVPSHILAFNELHYPQLQEVPNNQKNSINST
jgi:hypothetical protein